LPEIIEVATFARQLDTEYGEHTLEKVEVIGGRFLKSEDDTRVHLACETFPMHDVSMHSKGKFLYWQMLNHEDDPRYFFITLGMSGSFGKRQKHSALRFQFDNGEVFFNDPRHFGTFRIVESELELSIKLKSLGWDPLKEPNVPSDIVAKIRKHDRKKIGEFLMEQGPILCGIGNYLRAELLFDAKISPLRTIASLSDQEIETICQSAIDVIKEASAHGGATIATYSDLYGIAGTYFQKFKVYGREASPDGHPVLKVKDKNGRTMHYVPEVQI